MIEFNEIIAKIIIRFILILKIWVDVMLVFHNTKADERNIIEIKENMMVLELLNMLISLLASFKASVMG